ncbi:MAG: hypothetical protein QM774_08545 [Gordonia sp. (in: high G+C Gram-positive bacteria)]|uniref:LGFP repeat-containing protein n=1 Tax=Gordonia sp. (in: high G+C Gram-positive bacteria) TaxID=84139 RepID=UPI0039E456BD
MKTMGRWRARGAVLGLASVLGAAAFLAPAAHADAQSDATDAINDLASKIESGDADRGYNDTGLGEKTGDVEQYAGGYRENFSGGTIYWSEANGAKVVYGDINAKYTELGGADADNKLGLPVTSEEDGPFKPTSRELKLVGEDNTPADVAPRIYWTPEKGAYLVRGPFAAAVDKAGDALGAPVGDIQVNGDTITQEFANGPLSYNVNTGEWTSPNADLQGKLAGGLLAGLTLPKLANLGLPGLPGLDLSRINLNLPSFTAPDLHAPNVSAPDVNLGKHHISPWWWLLLLIPLALLALWWLLTRGRKGDLDVHGANLTGDVKAGDAHLKGDLKKAGAATAGAAAAGVAATKAAGRGVKGAADDAVDATKRGIKDVDAKVTGKGKAAGAAAAGAAGAAGAAAKGAAGSAGAAATGAAGAAATGAAAAAGKAAGDGVGTYTFQGKTVPVPVGGHLPLADPNEAPAGYNIKGNADSGLYHTPESRSYKATIAEIWFATEAAAKAAGFKHPDGNA